MAHRATLGSWPSYQNDFYAPGRLFRPRYPSLWQGCVGAWCPSLGPTGTTLRDWSGFARHGTLVTMDPPNDWVTSNGRYALDFDGSNDHITLGDLSAAEGSTFSYSLWCRHTTTINGLYLFSEGSTSAGDTVSGIATVNTGAIRSILRYDAEGGGGIFMTSSVSNVNDGQWHHVAVSVLGGAGVMYVDGKQVASNSKTPGTLYIERATIAALGRTAVSSYYPGQLDDILVYKRPLKPQEMITLATRRGIAYEYDDDLSSSEQAAAASTLLLRLQTEGLFVGSVI